MGLKNGQWTMDFLGGMRRPSCWKQKKMKMMEDDEKLELVVTLIDSNSFLSSPSSPFSRKD